MCGILAIILADPNGSAVTDIHNGLPILQHRGQDACGIATCGPRGRIYTRKGNGLCSEVFRYPEQLMDLPGNMGLGHCTLPLVLALTPVFYCGNSCYRRSPSHTHPMPIMVFLVCMYMILELITIYLRRYLTVRFLLRIKQCVIPPLAPQPMPKPSRST